MHMVSLTVALALNRVIKINLEEKDKLLPDRAFINNTAYTIYQCLDICYRFNYCKSINYVKTSQLCMLNSEDSSTVPIITMSGTVYMDKTQFPGVS